MDEDGFRQDYIQHIFLEKLPIRENGIPKCFNKNNYVDELIWCASKLIRGEMQLDAFISIFLEWQKEKE